MEGPDRSALETGGRGQRTPWRCHIGELKAADYRISRFGVRGRCAGPEPDKFALLNTRGRQTNGRYPMPCPEGSGTRGARRHSYGL